MDVGVASLIGAGLSLTGGLFSNGTNKKIARENLAYQREANEKNMQLTKEANEANIQLQRDINNQNIAFQQQENDITRMREDNAVQRAAADMTAAGLSKTLAAGNPASAQGLTAPQAESPQVQRAQVQALNNQYKYESALQKMNIAQLLQDMSVKDEQLKQSKALNDANIKLIEAQAENYNNQNSVFMQNNQNEQLLKLSSIALNNVKADQAKAETELTKIVGEYKAQELQSEIDLKIQQRLYYGSQVKLNEKSIEKMSFEIAHIICQYNHLNKETELVLKDIAYKELQIEALGHDLEVAGRFGLPVGSQPNGLFGSALSTGVALKYLISSSPALNFLFTGKTYVPDMEFPSLGGGSAW